MSMGKKIGNSIGMYISIAICVLVSVHAQSEITCSLTVTDRQGRRVNTVQVGVPFNLVATVQGKDSNLPKPQLTGVDRSFIKNQSQSQQMRSINGNVSVLNEYSYMLVLNKEGNYTFGPVVCEHNGKAIESPTVSVTAAIKTRVDDIDSQNAFASLTFSKNEVYYQEPVDVIVRFYYSLEGIQLREMSEIIVPNCISEETSAPQTGSEVIKGVEYRYVEWKKRLYPSQVGTLEVSPIAMRYAMPHRMHGMMGHGNTMFADLFEMMSGVEERQETYSNGAKLQVKALPEHTPPVQAVGKYDSVKLSVNNAHATVGEGLVISLEVEGRGNLYALSHPTLHFADEFTMYQGNAHYNKKGKTSKTFEYVLQASAPGTYTIDSQEFTYFDLDTQTYKTLSTEPITVEISPMTSHSLSSNVQDNVVEAVVHNDTLSITDQGTYKMIPRVVMSWTLFYTLLIIQICIGLSMLVYVHYKKAYDKGASQRRYLAAFSSAKSQLELARKKKYYGYVYHIFIRLFADRYKVDTQIISEEFIEEKLKYFFTQSELSQWRLFYNTMSEYAFAERAEHHDILFNQASQWLQKCEKIL